MAVTKIYTGAAFEEVRYKMWDGSAWIDVPKLWDGSAWVDLNSQGPVVDVGIVFLWNIRLFGGGCSAKVKWDNNGQSYKSDNLGAYGSSYETWLLEGLNTQVWVERTISTGTLSLDTIGAGRPIMSSDRELGVQASSGISTATGTVSFYDAASGGNLLDSTTWNITAEVDPL